MTEFTRNEFSKKSIDESQNGNCGQGPIDGTSRHFQNDEEEKYCNDHLKIPGKKTVLF